MINIYEVSQDALALKHYDAVVQELRKKNTRMPSTLNKWFKSFDVNYTLKHVITAKPKDLRVIMNKCKLDKYPGYIMELHDMYKMKFSKASGYIGKAKNKYNAVQLMENLGIEVCPLCNRNYITNVEPEGRNLKRTGQLDHYHDKATYPFLAMSFFNLVPACYGCNHTKSSFELEQTPYGEVDLDPLITFKVSFNKIEDIYDEQHVKVSLDNHPSIQKNIDVLGLQDSYTKYHNKDAFSVVNTFKNYNELSRTLMIENFRELFDNEDQLWNMIFSEYVGLTDKLKSVPLAKLKKDIYEQLEKYRQSSVLS
ncbi:MULTISPECIES: hypothetical protein [unclassified Paenibacillus]|uniref:HNH endonuclease n=1 Tax=Paenibacillus provencensis TaxID=441151 RepID=A0ABW3QHD6_9BACL|nr:MULTISPECIES: hypothetical protein [unclassified Paenibacillus]MCM3130627.1 hypothetical protein [Paenibacillus sp. MER 78]SDX74130.1 hypothetical protein SAMN05518848_11342 [Paenibacillus sp. PDC88]SFS89641.1 hypothetical protein SAMN04488601_106162 [Paenibacillus sp. 453mf]